MLEQNPAEFGKFAYKHCCRGYDGDYPHLQGKPDNYSFYFFARKLPGNSMKVSALVKWRWMIFPFTMWFHFLLISPHDGYGVWIWTKRFSFFLLFLSPFLWKTLLFSETKLLTITGKKYFSTVLVVRTSAQDPNGLK